MDELLALLGRLFCKVANRQVFLAAGLLGPSSSADSFVKRLQPTCSRLQALALPYTEPYCIATGSAQPRAHLTQALMSASLPDIFSSARTLLGPSFAVFQASMRFGTNMAAAVLPKMHQHLLPKWRTSPSRDSALFLSLYQDYLRSLPARLAAPYLADLDRLPTDSCQPFLL